MSLSRIAAPRARLTCSSPLGQRTAPASRSRANGTAAGMAARNGAFAVPLGPVARPAHGGRSTWGSTRRPWKSARGGQLRRRADAAGAPQADRPGSGNCNRHRQVADGCATGPSTAGGACGMRLPRRHRRPRCGSYPPAPPQRAAKEAGHRRGPGPERDPAGIQAPRPDALEELERLPPPQQGGDMGRIGKRSGGALPRRLNELREVAGPERRMSACHRLRTDGSAMPRLRPPGGKGPDPRGGPQPLRDARDTGHRRPGASAPGARGAAAASRFAQQRLM